MSSAQPLGAVLKSLIDRLGYREPIDNARAVEGWAFVAGPQINGVTDRVWAKEGKLFVQLRSAVWRQQLHMQRGQWCRKLNDELGGEVIREIVFR